MAFPRAIRRRVAPADGNGNGAPQTFDGQVGASSDDAWQAFNNVMDLTAARPRSDRTDEHIGMRWTSVTVPAGATIDVAHVGLELWGPDNDEPKHQIRGELTANPGTFTTTSDDIDSRGRTTASVNWDSADLGATDGELWEWGSSIAGTGNGANLNAIVQEIVDLGGWASGNSLIMIFEQHTSHSAFDLAAYHYDNAPGDAPRIHIEFTA